jgi:hypothetical protein
MTTQDEKEQSIKDFVESLQEASRKLATVAAAYQLVDEDCYEILKTFGVVCAFVEEKAKNPEIFIGARH